MHYSNCMPTPSCKVHVSRKIYYCIWNHKQAFWFQHILTPNSIYSPKRGHYRFTHRGLTVNVLDRQQSIYTSLFHVTSLDRGWLAWHQGLKGLSCRWSGNRIYSWRRSVLGGFFGRTVDSRVGKLLIKRGIHIGLEEQEWFRDKLAQSCLRQGQLQSYPVSLACFNSNADTWGAVFYPHSLRCV